MVYGDSHKLYLVHRIKSSVMPRCITLRHNIYLLCHCAVYFTNRNRHFIWFCFIRDAPRRYV